MTPRGEPLSTRAWLRAERGPPGHEAGADGGARHGRRAVSDAPIGSARKWAITFSVMLVTVMQVLDTSITNVALPHMQGSFSASIEEMSWVITSFLAANAVVIPASGWLTSVFGRRRFYLICTVTFTASSFLSGIAPNLEFLVAMRILQGLGGGAVVPMAQAIMWEIFPLEQRGTAMTVWGIGIMMAPILGPTVGGLIADNWSWRWIFYINLPIGILAFFMVSAFLFDAPFHQRPRRVDIAGIVLMVLGFGCLQLVLDLGERRDWFDSPLIVGTGVLAVITVAGFIVRELVATEPILDLTVFADRNFGICSLAIFLTALGFNSSLLLVALYTQKILGYDAWTSGLTLAPGGLGTMIALMISGRLVSRMDQRLMLAGGCLLHAWALDLMMRVTPTMDFWGLAWPRFIQGFSMGFIFLPLQALALAAIPTVRLGNATAAYNVLRNFGGSMGVALVTTLLARRSQQHQVTLASHLDVWSPEMAQRLQGWTGHFVAGGADSFTAGRRAVAMVYREMLEQAQILSYADDFWLLLLVYCSVLLLIPFMRRVRSTPATRTAERAESAARDPGLPAPTD
jgi:MFS transporter, DHA2 family, multidrug resistance protein